LFLVMAVTVGAMTVGYAVVSRRLGRLVAEPAGGFAQ
jgi:hypothetical protein